MKKGKLIVNNIILSIEFEKNPSITLDEKINEDGSKELNGTPKWNPFKFNILNDYGFGCFLSRSNCNIIFLILDNENNVFELCESYIDFKKQEIIFKNATLYQ